MLYYSFIIYANFPLIFSLWSVLEIHIRIINTRFSGFFFIDSSRTRWSPCKPLYMCLFFSQVIWKVQSMMQLLTFVGYTSMAHSLMISFGFTILYQLRSKAFFWSSNQKRACFLRYIELTVISHLYYVNSSIFSVYFLGTTKISFVTKQYLCDSGSWSHIYIDTL